jgi:hypothetical protein
MLPIRYTISGPATTGSSNAIYTDGSKFAFSDYSPPTDAHTIGCSVREVDIRPPFYSPMNTAESKVSYYRIRVNGVDTTGVVECDVRMNSIVNYRTNVRTCAYMFDVPSDGSHSEYDAVEMDLWFYLSFLRSECGSQLQPDALNPFTLPYHLRAFTVPGSGTYEAAPYNMLWTGVNANARVANADVFEITWGTNPPGGTNPLTLEPQSGWTCEKVSQTSILMTKTSAPSSGERVYFDWGREIPYVVATRSVSMPSGLRPIGRYLPADSGDYNQSIAGQTNGVWDPASTVFPVMGFQTVSGNPIWATSSLALSTNMPQTCTIERV